MNKVIVSLLLTMSVLIPAQAQLMICGKKDYNRMSQNQLKDAYCSADTATASAVSDIVTDEHTASLQRQCLDEKGNVAKVLQQKFKLVPPECSPLIESSKK